MLELNLGPTGITSNYHLPSEVDNANLYHVYSSDITFQ